MYLKKIDIQGFKSFANKISFDLSKGITGFVGPNGCGKSNVVDAVKWGLGEQRVSTLRGDCMQDVIFKGNGTRSPMNFAEVSIYFDNTSGSLPVEYDEVVVTRRLFRSGESEYQLNRSACRLKDIRGLFLDTGVGVSAYSFMEQGRIDSVLQANPVDRRAIFEEAAGISRYKTHRREAERKLDRTEANLLRVGDIIEELERRIRSLKNQAGRARNYIIYRDRLRKLQRDHLLHVYNILNEELDRIATRRAEADEQVRNLEGELTEKREGLLLLDREIEVISETLGARKTRLAEVKTSLEETEEKIGSLEQRTGTLRTESVEIAERERGVTASLEKTERAREDIEARHKELMKEEIDIIEEEALRDEELRTVEARWNDTLNALNRLNECALQLNRRDMDLTNKTVEAEARHKGLLGSLARYTGRQNALAGEMSEVRALMTRTESELADQEAERDLLTNHLREGRIRERSKEEELRSIDTELNRVTSERIKRESRIELLRNLIEKREGVGRGAKAVLEEASRDGSSLHFIQGMVGELLEVDVSHSSALEAALGGTAEALVVENLDQAREVLRYVIDLDLGRVGILPLCVFEEEGAGLSAGEGGEEGYSPWPSENADTLSMRVESSTSRVKRAVDRLLDDVGVIRRDELTDPSPDRMRRFVTAEGDLLERFGLIHLGGAGGEPGLISRRSELTALEGELSELNHEQDELVSLRSTTASELEDMSLENRGLAERIEKKSEAVAWLNGEREKRLERWNHIRREYGVNGREYYEFERDAHGLKREIQDLRGETANLRRDIEKQEAAILKTRAEVDVSQRERERIEEARKAIEFRKIQFRERVESIETERRIIEQNLKEARIRLDEFKRDRERSAALLETLTHELENTRRKTGRLLEDRSALTEEVAGLVKDLESQRLRLETLREDISVREAAYEDVRRQADDLRGDAREAQVKLDSLREKARDELDLDPDEPLDTGSTDEEGAWNERVDGSSCTAIDDGGQERSVDEGRKEVPSLGEVEETSSSQSDEAPASKAASDDERAIKADSGHRAEEEDRKPVDWEAVEEEIRALRGKIARMGNVNLDAIHELEEVEQRYEALSVQRDDLKLSIKQLNEMIVDLNRQSRELFIKTFESVRGHFNTIFRKLFQGGKADLKLREDGDVLEAGIDVMAGPPGKDMRSINLLSGGERTLTAVGLLFALFKSRPSPFCILDEVDAALDEVNIERFCNLLGDFVADSQFIIVTHSKRTMSYCDFLYGITMQENGVSTRMALNLEAYGDQVA